MINLIVGTETGTAEFVADEVLELLERNNIAAQATLEPVLEQLIDSNLWMIITSTHGAGDIPDNLQAFVQNLDDNNHNLTGKKIMIIALGDSNYDTFCQAGTKIEDLLLSLKMDLIAPMLKVDAIEEDMPEDIVIRWLTQYMTKILDLN